MSRSGATGPSWSPRWAAVSRCPSCCLFLIGTIVTGRGRASETREAIASLNKQLNTVQTHQSGFDAALRRPENAEVLERSVMLNALIERKAISWTRIFGDLEKVMPYNVRLIYIRLPQVNSSNQVTLDMVVGAQSVEPLAGVSQGAGEVSRCSDPRPSRRTCRPLKMNRSTATA